MKVQEHQISKARLRKIVTEELRRLHEEVDADGIKDVANVAGDLLKAAKRFNEKANESMAETLGPHLAHVVAVLEKVMQNPSAFVPRSKPQQQVVQLRQVDVD